jgi:hypothetical protein
MGNESLETKLARMEERLSAMLTELESARHGRKQQYEKQEEFGRSLMTIGNRLENVENSLARASPTIEEFVVIKHKVIGAGIMGKWLWVMGGGLLGFVFSMREAIIAWLSK